MRMLLTALILAGAVAAPLAARQRDDPQAQLDKMIAGRTAGAPVECISLGPTNNRSSTIDGIGTTYEQGRTLYVNRFEGGCPELRWDRMIVTRTPMARLCRGDIAEIRDRTLPSVAAGACTFGAFTPYRRAGK